MGLKARLAAAALAFTRATGRVVPVPSLEGWLLSRPWWLPPEALDYPHAFRLIPSINFCVSLIQQHVAKMPLEFFVARPGSDPRKIEVERDGQIASMWSTANTEETGYQVMEQLVGSLLLQGNAYLFKDYAGTAKVRQFWILCPTAVSPVPGPNRTTAYYEVKDGNQTVEVPRQQIVHFRMYDPEHKITGSSPMQALRLSYETERDASRWMRLFYQKGGSVAGHYTTENAMEQDDIDRLKKDVRMRFQGPENAWEPVVLPNSLKYVRSGLSVEEMRFIENHSLVLEDILRVFKVPPMLAGLAKGSGMNSDVARISRLMLHEDAIEPMCQRITTTLNENMLKSGEFGFGVYCAFDYSGVLAVQEVFLDQAKAYQVATGAPVMTRAEARRRLNLPEIDDSSLDKLLLPANMLDDSALEEEKSTPAPEAAEKKSRMAASASKDSARKRASRAVFVYERQVRAGFRRMLSSQEARTLSRLKSQAAGKSRYVDADELLRDDSVDVRLVRKLIRAVVAGRGQSAIEEAAADLTFDMAAHEVSEFVDKKATKAVTDVNETTRRMLRDSISEGVAENETIGELAARVSEVFDGRRANALTIARTETAGAYNFASLEGWDQSGVVEMKEWLTSHDESVRPTHAAAEAQGAIPLDQAFSVGDDMLEFPGQPGGSPEEVINCRCTMVPVLKSEFQESGPLPTAIRDRLSGVVPSHGRNGGGPVTLEDLIRA